jgi:rfaE bifunctional protein kinase chain/domain
MIDNLDKKTFSNKRILIVGDIMLDEYIYTEEAQKSTEYKNIESCKIHSKKQYLGGAANVALNIKKLGSTPYLVGVIGKDENGKKINQISETYTIHTKHIIQTNIKTTTKTRIFKNKIPIIRIDEEEKNAYENIILEFIILNTKNIITQHKPNAIILQDYNKGVLNAYTIKEILKIAAEFRIPVFVDPKLKNWRLYKQVTYFKPNKNEFDFICNDLKLIEKNQNQRIKIIKEKLKCVNMLITLGKNGNKIIDNNKQIYVQKINSIIKNADVCGAGDSVIAIVCLAYLAKFHTTEIGYLANLAGQIACQNQNTYAIDTNDIIDIIKKKK